MVKLQDQVNFVDDVGKSFIGTVVEVNPNGTINVKVKRKIGFEAQVFLNVPTPNAKKDNKPHYTELSATKKETPKKKE